MKRSAGILLAVSLFWYGGNVSAQNFEPLELALATPDQRLGTYIRCAALGMATWKTVNPDFAVVVGVSSKHAFFSLSRQQYFDEMAHNMAFAAAGHDWKTLWERGQVQGALPLWTLTVGLGVDELQKRTGRKYRQIFDKAKAGDQTSVDLLKHDLDTCASGVTQ